MWLVPSMDRFLRKHLLETMILTMKKGALLQNILHPVQSRIIYVSLSDFMKGHLNDAAWDTITCVFSVRNGEQHTRNKIPKYHHLWSLLGKGHLPVVWVKKRCCYQSLVMKVGISRTNITTTRCSLYIDIVQVQILTQFTDVDHPLVHKPGDRKSLVDYSIFKWGNEPQLLLVVATFQRHLLGKKGGGEHLRVAAFDRCHGRAQLAEWVGEWVSYDPLRGWNMIHSDGLPLAFVKTRGCHYK